MKFRCVQDSIRFRLRKSDIQLLKETGEIVDSLNFLGGQKLSYGLQLSDEEHSASLDGSSLLVCLNAAKAKNWMDSKEVCLAFEIEIGDDKVLSVLVEKDFPCKHTGEDFEDTYYELQPEEFKMFRKNQISEIE